MCTFDFSTSKGLATIDEITIARPVVNITFLNPHTGQTVLVNDNLKVVRKIVIAHPCRPD